MSAWFTRIKNFYDKGLWTIQMVADVVEVGRITEEEFEEITGKTYQFFLNYPNN